MPKSYGIVLKEIREKNKKTQSDIAHLIGKSTMYISNIEKGKNGPLKGKDLDVILEALQVKEEDAIRIKSKALLESRKMPEELLRYFMSNPCLLELMITLCANNVEEDNEDILKTYYERIMKNHV